MLNYHLWVENQITVIKQEKQKKKSRLKYVDFFHTLNRDTYSESFLYQRIQMNALSLLKCDGPRTNIFVSDFTTKQDETDHFNSVDAGVKQAVVVWVNKEITDNFSQ